MLLQTYLALRFGWVIWPISLKQDLRIVTQLVHIIIDLTAMKVE